MNVPTRHLVALVIASNLMGCQLIKKFTDRHHDAGVATGTTVVTLDGGGMAMPAVAEYDAAGLGDAGAAANAAIAAANAAMAAAGDASAQANAAMQNAMADASMAAPPPPVAPGSDPAAPPPVAAADPAAPPPVAPPPAEPAAPPSVAPMAPAAESDPEHHHGGHHGDFCVRHPGELNPRTGQICPNVLGSQNLMH